METNSGAIRFVLVTAFISTMGASIIIPVIPFIVDKYGAGALAVNLLIASFSLSQFLAAPLLGKLSDRFGRRPILLFSVFGSAIGFLIFGIGGALWMLFLGRIIDGMTGGNISTVMSTIADITPPEKRARQFALVGAAMGVGLVVGPVIGGLLSQNGYSLPLYAASALALANFIWGFFAMRESLPADKRSRDVVFRDLNPFLQLRGVLEMKDLRNFLFLIFLSTLPIAILVANIAMLARDSLHWQPTAIGMGQLVFGVFTIATQAWLIRRLMPMLGERKLAVMGLSLEAIGYACFALVYFSQSSVVMFAGIFSAAVGSGLADPSIASLLSAQVGAEKQGLVQGSSSAVQALSRISGPLIGGILYAASNPGLPFWFAALVLLCAMGIFAAFTQNTLGASSKIID
jgi:DHA1 family tetracycline resistance protein-like MFS transporter